MGDVFQLEESSFSYFEDDAIALAQILTVKVAEKPYVDDNGEKVKKVEFKVAVIDPGGAHDNSYLWGETPTRFNSHPDCKLRNWAQAILNQELPAGFQLDTDMLEDQRVRIIVGYKEYTKGDGTPGKRNFIKDVLPLQTETSTAAVGGLMEEPF